MRYLSILLAIAFVFGICYISTLTSNQVLSFSLVKHSKIFVNGSYYTLMVFATGVLTGVCALFIKNCNLRNQINMYKKKHEKMSVIQDSSTSEVSVLKAKIDTLEKALEKALNK